MTVLRQFELGPLGATGTCHCAVDPVVPDSDLLMAKLAEFGSRYTGVFRSSKLGGRVRHFAAKNNMENPELEVVFCILESSPYVWVPKLSPRCHDRMVALR
jgi:hypothetical protein